MSLLSRVMSYWLPEHIDQHQLAEIVNFVVTDGLSFVATYQTSSMWYVQSQCRDSVGERPLGESNDSGKYLIASVGYTVAEVEMFAV